MCCYPAAIQREDDALCRAASSEQGQKRGPDLIVEYPRQDLNLQPSD